MDIRETSILVCSKIEYEDFFYDCVFNQVVKIEYKNWTMIAL